MDNSHWETNPPSGQWAQPALHGVALAILSVVVGACVGTPSDGGAQPGTSTASIQAAKGAGVPNIIVSGRRAQQANAGTYGYAVLFSGSRSTSTVLQLNGGQFSFRDIYLGNHARLECLAPCTMEVAGRVKTGIDSFIGPAEDHCVSPADVSLIVAGGAGGNCMPLASEAEESESGAELAVPPDDDEADAGASLGVTPGPGAFCGPDDIVDIGRASLLEARVSAPNGTIEIGADSTVRADLSAQNVVLGKNVVVQPAGSPFVLDDGNACTADSCDYATGSASDTPVADGTPCDDGNVCTQTDTCQSGTCVGGNPVSCSPVDQCHLAGTCDPVAGCSSTPVADGTLCDDGNMCTQTGSCQAGTCVGGNPVTCSPVDRCQLAGTCDPVAGCSYPLFSGRANLTGTEGLPVGAPGPGQYCEPLVTSNTSGALTFSFTDSQCTFNYADATGSSYGSTITNPPGVVPPWVSSNGDTYQCAYMQNGYAQGIWGPCPELTTKMMGVSASITLTVKRSTGAVALSRSCVYEGTCLGGYMSPGLTSQFSLSGSISCN